MRPLFTRKPFVAVDLPRTSSQSRDEVRRLRTRLARAARLGVPTGMARAVYEVLLTVDDLVTGRSVDEVHATQALEDADQIIELCRTWQRGR